MTSTAGKSRPRRWQLGILGGWFFTTIALPLARAENPPPARSATAAPESTHERRRVQWGALPALGYNPDTGFDVGVFMHMVALDPEVEPYAWQLRGQIQTSLLFEDGLQLPKNDHYVRLDLPELPDAESRLRLELAWLEQLNAGYFGVGNATQAIEPGAASEHFHEYAAETVRAKVILERSLGRPEWRWLAGLVVSRIDVDPYGQSLLAEDVARAEERGGSIPGERTFTALVGHLGLVLDTRDDETFPTRGVFHDLVFRASPALADGPAWGGVTYTTRFYRSIIGDRLVLATRVLGDVLLGDAPLTELARHGGLLDARSFGDADGVRGIPGGRFIGKTKVLETAELRAQLLPFRLFDDDMNLGAAAFIDAGRVWSGSLAPDGARDGAAFGQHWGVGGGARLRWGESLMVRLELAHSPHTNDTGDGELATYLTADSKF